MSPSQWQLWMKRSFRWLSAWSDSHREWILAGAAVILLRIWFAALGIVAVLYGASADPWGQGNMFFGVGKISAEGFGVFLAPWQRWDAIWYQQIASVGYSAGNASGSFFPLFPILMRRVGTILGGNLVLAGVVICTIATFFAFVLLHRLSTQAGDRAAANRAVIYWAVFPTSFYLFGGYAESLLAACALATIYFARRKNWCIVGVAAGAATLTRPVGVLVVIPAVIEALSQNDTWHRRAKMILPLLLGVALGMGAWMLYLHLTYNDALLWVHAEESWKRVFIFPGQTILLTARYIVEARDYLANNIVDLALTGLVFGSIVAGARKLPLSYTAYALAMLVVPLASYALVGSFAAMPMAAGGRRAMVVLPAFIVLGQLIRGRWLQPTWMMLSLSLQAVLFFEFARWMWVD